jgi:hypothetical protein
MVTRAVSKKSVERIKGILEKNLKRRMPVNSEMNFFLKLRSADHRKPGKSVISESFCGEGGFAVREIRTKEGKLIVKVPQYDSSRKTVAIVKEFVKEVMQTKPKKFVLLEPKGTQVGRFIIMRPTNTPSVSELLKYEKDKQNKKTKIFFSKMSKKTGLTEIQIRTKLDRAFKELINIRKELDKKRENTEKFTYEMSNQINVHVIGFDGKQFLFVSLMDGRRK